jgi:hypothetical protein
VWVVIKLAVMPLNLPRKKRRIPTGLRVGNGGCYFEKQTRCTNNNDPTNVKGTSTSDTESDAMESFISRRKLKLRARNEKSRLQESKKSSHRTTGNDDGRCGRSEK